MMTITIRPATRDDVPVIVRLLADDPLGSRRELLEDPVAPVYLRAVDEMANQPGNELVVAVEGDEVIGCLQLTIVTGLSRRGIRRALLEGVRVSSGHRGEKVGEQLVQYAIARARAAGCGLVQLTSDVSRLDARRFYEKLGFKATHIGMKLPLLSGS
ncbi:MAG: GNAT family N-acetyltransferase [Vicinamibacterales bacterium]